MHLLIDCRSIHTALGGIGRVAYHLTRAMAAAASDRITALIGAAPPEHLELGRVELVQAEAAMIDEAFEQLLLPSIVADLQPDVYLNPAFSVPAIRGRTAQVAIIHDVVFEDHPDLVEPRLRAYLSRWSRVAADHADGIVAVSEHARARIVARYGRPMERITVIHNGLAAEDREAVPAAAAAEVRRRLGLHRPYLLFLGSLEAKKGVAELGRAYRRLLEDADGLDVVLAGGAGPRPWQELFGPAPQGRVHHLGYVDEMTRRALLAGCAALVYPSLYEGFGLPPLEALAIGMPVVAHAGSCLPEILGDDALLVDVQDVEAFASALGRAGTDADVAARARRDGPARAARYRWDMAARAYWDLCRSVAR